MTIFDTVLSTSFELPPSLVQLRPSFFQLPFLGVETAYYRLELRPSSCVFEVKTATATQKNAIPYI